MKKILIIVSCIVSIICINVNAYEWFDEEQLVAMEEKYYKIESSYNSTSLMSTNSNGYSFYTTEVSKEEYENYNPVCSIQSETTETTYKKMTTSIFKNNSNYRYQVELNWKNIPKVRSYDIIGIGYLSSVKSTGVTFSHKYCTSNTNCKEIKEYSHLYNSANGVGIVFPLQEGELTSMSQILSVIVSKNTTATILKQYAYGDYSHATSKITLSNAKRFKVNSSGIVLENEIMNYYDAINSATATWAGTW